MTAQSLPVTLGKQFKNKKKNQRELTSIMGKGFDKMEMDLFQVIKITI